MQADFKNLFLTVPVTKTGWPVLAPSRCMPEYIYIYIYIYIETMFTCRHICIAAQGQAICIADNLLSRATLHNRLVWGGRTNIMGKNHFWLTAQYFGWILGGIKRQTLMVKKYILLIHLKRCNFVSVVMYSARCRRPWGTSRTDQDDDQDLAQLRRRRGSHRGHTVTKPHLTFNDCSFLYRT